MKHAKAVCHLSIRNLSIKDRPPFLHPGEKDEADLRAESAITSASQCGQKVSSPAVWSEATEFWREGCYIRILVSCSVFSTRSAMIAVRINLYPVILSAVGAQATTESKDPENADRNQGATGSLREKRFVT
jgi:hypothetical protein